MAADDARHLESRLFHTRQYLVEKMYLEGPTLDLHSRSCGIVMEGKAEWINGYHECKDFVCMGVQRSGRDRRHIVANIQRLVPLSLVVPSDEGILEA